MRKCTSLNYIDGALENITIYDVERASADDCRDHAEPFVAIRLGDGSVTVTGYLPPEVAGSLWVQLDKIIGQRVRAETARRNGT